MYPSLKNLLSVLHEDVKLSTGEEILTAIKLIIRVQEMTSGESDCIKASFERGPLWAGDVPSKTARDTLTLDGFMEQVVVKKEEGFNACTYKGARAYRLLKIINGWD